MSPGFRENYLSNALLSALQNTRLIVGTTE